MTHTSVLEAMRLAFFFDSQQRKMSVNALIRALPWEPVITVALRFLPLRCDGAVLNVRSVHRTLSSAALIPQSSIAMVRASIDFRSFDRVGFVSTAALHVS